MLDPDRRHLLAYLAAAAVLVVLAVRLIGHAGGEAPTPSVATAAPTTPIAGMRAGRPPAAAAKRLIWVDVAGAVRRPGLYSLPAGARVAAALARAGGPLRRAETTAVNLAAKLADGQQVVVPLRARGAAGGVVVPPGASGSGAGVIGGAGPTAASPSGAAGAIGAGGSGAKISLSTATQEQLEQLDGIGPALAGRIIAYRETHGGFRSVDELQEVSGIGSKRFEALRGSVAP